MMTNIIYKLIVYEFYKYFQNYIQNTYRPIMFLHCIIIRFEYRWDVSKPLIFSFEIFLDNKLLLSSYLRHRRFEYDWSCCFERDTICWFLRLFHLRRWFFMIELTRNIFNTCALICSKRFELVICIIQTSFSKLWALLMWMSFTWTLDISSISTHK